MRDQNSRPNYYPELPLRSFPIVPFVLHIFAAVGLVGYLSFRNGQIAVNDLASQLMSEVSDRTADRLDSYLKIPHLINTMNYNEIGIAKSGMLMHNS